MHARVSTGEVQPGKKDEFVNSYRDSAMPANKQQRGFKGQLLLQTPIRSRPSRSPFGKRKPT